MLANAELPEVRHSLEPLNLSRPPTAEEIMAAGQLRGQLYPTYEVEDNDGEMLLNFSFGQKAS